MKYEKISYMEAIAIIAIVIINKVILVLPKEIISSTGSSAWLNVLFVSIIAILIAWFTTFLFKKFQGLDILDISEFLGGKTLKTIIGLLYIILLILVPIFVLKNFTETLRIIYFKTSPLLFILLFFIVSSTIANRFSLKVLTKANLLLMGFTFLGITLILISSIKDFSMERLFPILGYGVKQTFLNGLTNIFSFSAFGYLFLLPPLLDKPSNFKKISIISMIISGLYLFLTVTCILLALSFTFKSGESVSLYLLTRNLAYGRFIQKIDAVFILMWIISIIIYISFAIYFTIYIIQKLTKITDTSSINYTINFIILATLLIPINLATFSSIVGPFFKITTLIVLFGLSILILILANLKQINKNKMKGTTENI